MLSSLALLFSLSSLPLRGFQRGHASSAYFNFLGEVEGRECAECEAREGGLARMVEDGPAMHGCAVHVLEHFFIGRAVGTGGGKG